MMNGDATKLAVAAQDRIDAAVERGFPGQVFFSLILDLSDDIPHIYYYTLEHTRT